MRPRLSGLAAVSRGASPASLADSGRVAQRGTGGSPRAACRCSHYHSSRLRRRQTRRPGIHRLGWDETGGGRRERHRGGGCFEVGAVAAAAGAAAVEARCAEGLLGGQRPRPPPPPLGRRRQAGVTAGGGQEIALSGHVAEERGRRRPGSDGPGKRSGDAGCRRAQRRRAVGCR